MQYKSLLSFTFLTTATWCNGQVPVPLSLPGHSILCICCRDDVPAYPCVQKTENTSKLYGLARILERTDMFCISLSILHMVLQLICLSLFLSLMLNKNDKFDTTSILIEFDFKLSKWGCIRNEFR